MDRTDRAKIFWSGRSQAVRLPKEYRFEGTEVRIRRRGNAVILESIPADWRWLDALVSSDLDSDFVDAIAERVDDQRRPGLQSAFE